MAGSMVLMTFHRDRSSLVAGPRPKLTASGLILELGSSVPEESPAVWFFSKPRSACRASIMRAESRRTSAGGTWARFAISSVSREMRSTVVSLLRSSGGRIWA